MIYHKVLPDLIALCFDLAAHNMHTEVLCLTSNASKNWRSYFLALEFFTVAYWLGEIGLLSVPPSGVDKIYSSRMAL